MNFKYKELHILYRYKCLLCNYYQKIKKYSLFIKIKYSYFANFEYTLLFALRIMLLKERST